MKLLYNILICLAAPCVWLFTALRGLRDAAYRERLGERFGFTRVRFTTAPIWLHAVSVGEVRAAVPLLKRLLAMPGQRPILMTTSTPTGAAQVRTLFEGRVTHAYLPYDTPGSVQRFLSRVQPHCAVVMETELWPNLFGACVRRDIPLLLASARISSRTAHRYARLAGLFTDSLPRVHVGAQTGDDAKRFLSLGVQPAHLSITGNIKFDIEIGEDVRVAGRAFRQQQLAQRPVWIAGSTHEGEEEQVLAAHKQLLAVLPAALLMLAPRHPQRFAQVESLLRSQDVSFVARSSGQAVQPSHSVFLLDTLGELPRFYAASDVAFVAGSLMPVGGHNLLEPAALDVPVVSGPYTFNAPDIAQKLAEHDALRYVYSPQELGGVVLELLNDPTQRAKLAASAHAVLDESRGALDTLLALMRSVCRVEVE